MKIYPNVKLHLKDSFLVCALVFLALISDNPFLVFPFNFVRKKRKQIPSPEILPRGTGKEKGQPGNNREQINRGEQLAQCIHPGKGLFQATVGSILEL